jgi:hypothetical protein
MSKSNKTVTVMKGAEDFRAIYRPSRRTLAIDMPYDRHVMRRPLLALVEAVAAIDWTRRSHASKRRYGQHWFHPSEDFVCLEPLPEEADPLAVAQAIHTLVFDGDQEPCWEIVRQWNDVLPQISAYQRGQDIYCRDGRGGRVRLWSYPKRGGIEVGTDDSSPDWAGLVFPDMAAVVRHAKALEAAR